MLERFHYSTVHGVIVTCKKTTQSTIVDDDDPHAADESHRFP